MIRGVFLLYLCFLTSIYLSLIVLPPTVDLVVWWAVRLGAGILAYVHAQRLGMRGIGWAAAVILAPAACNMLKPIINTLGAEFAGWPLFLLGNLPVILLIVLPGHGEKASKNAPEPRGPWIGVLFDRMQLGGSGERAAAVHELLAIAGAKHLAGTTIHEAPLPGVESICIAIHTDFREQARLIEVYVSKSESAKKTAGSAVLRGEDLPLDALRYLGFVSEDGTLTLEV